ncbi:MAG: porin family protein [Cyclobacteriaceae bacterium]|nr:porin family protein [Cyclobacteriaceae bacterium]
MNQPLFQSLGIVLFAMLVLSIPFSSVQAQTFYQYHKSGQLTLYAGGGLSKYFGELSNDRKLGDVNPHFTLGVSIPIRPKLFVRPEVSFYRLSAADSDLPEEDSRHNRNLSFKSNNWEASVMAVYGLYAQGSQSLFKPYIMGGVGITYFNPQAKLDGVWYELQPLFTEGIDYQKFIAVIPVGAGLGFKLNEQIEVALEMSYRFSFTDYLDDVSMTYRDPLLITDPIAAALADRRPEIGLEKAPAGSQRGNADSNDGYMFMGVKVFYQLPGQGPLRRKR